MPCLPRRWRSRATAAATSRPLSRRSCPLAQRAGSSSSRRHRRRSSSSSLKRMAGTWRKHRTARRSSRCAGGVRCGFAIACCLVLPSCYLKGQMLGCHAGSASGICAHLSPFSAPSQIPPAARPRLWSGAAGLARPWHRRLSFQRPGDRSRCAGCAQQASASHRLPTSLLRCWHLLCQVACLPRQHAQPPLILFAKRHNPLTDLLWVLCRLV